jgi:CRISPR/Cas system CSM-associated protein Csm3 (group 7 of RAMP superfamily)
LWQPHQAGGNDASEVRDSVGIGRQSQAAARERLFQQEVVPCGAGFTFSSCLHTDEEMDINLMAHCLDFWRHWGGRVGKATSSGLGQFNFSYRVEKLDAHIPDDLEKYLYDFSLPENSQQVDLEIPTPITYTEQCGIVSKILCHPAADDQRPRPCWQACSSRRQIFEAVRWEISLLPIGPLQIKTAFGAEEDELTIQKLNSAGEEQGIERVAPDASFLRTGKIDEQSIKEEHYIPGRSLKGVLRSHGERILRTCWELGHGKEAYTNCDATIVCDPNGSNVARLQPCNAANPCPACDLFGSVHYGGRVVVSEAYPSNPEFFRQQLKTLERVSIDRITSGAAEKRLFSVRPLFTPLTPNQALSLNFSVEMECPADWELGLMLFTLRDLCRSRLRVGFGKYVGQGKVTAAITKFEYLIRPGSPLSSKLPNSGTAVAVGALKLFASCWEHGLDIKSWCEEYNPLVEWADNGWLAFMSDWAQLTPKEGGVMVDG